MFKQPTWDLSGMVKDLGGVPKVRELCIEQALVAPPYRTLQNWKLGHSAPAHGVALLCSLIKLRFPSADLTRYIELKDAEGDPEPDTDEDISAFL